MRKKIAILIVALLLLGGSVRWYLKRESGGPSYREFTIEKGDLDITILATGTVQPENRLEIKPAVSGRIEQVLVSEGAKLRKGQILAWMSSTERAALLDAARAQGSDELKKWEEIYRPTPVFAPLAGTLILRNVEAGQTVTSNDAIFVMSDRLTVKAQVDETDISQVKLHQKADLILDAYPKNSISAQVDQIAFDAKTVSNVTTYVVDVLPDKTPEDMRSGMTANVTFDVQSKEDVLLVPAEAVKFDNGQALVQVKVPDQREPQEKAITIGLSDGKQIEVLLGLNEGDVVLVNIVKPKDRNGSPFSPMGNNKPRSGR